MAFTESRIRIDFSELQGETFMKFAGLALVIVGWLLSVATLPYTHSLKVRFILALLGIAISLFGILSVINRAHLKNVIWKA
jgi:cytochrome c biogenesis protein CcdA